MKKRIISVLLSVFAAVSMFAPCINAASFKEYGVDISHWNGTIDFAKVKASGIDFVILHVGYSNYDTAGNFTGKIDDTFEANYKGAKAAGLKVGAFIYSYAVSASQAQTDAKMFISWVAGKQFEYPLFFDIEDDVQKPLSDTVRTQMCLSYLSVMKKNGYLGGIYASENWFNNYLDLSSLSAYSKWIAKWTADGKDTAGTVSGYDMWQYTDSGSVNGISGSVDRDVCYTDFPTYIKSNYLNGYKSPEYDPDLPFDDVKISAWYYKSVKYVYDSNLFSGTSKTKFSPDMSMTRGMFVTVLGRLSGIDTAKYDSCVFLDVDMTKYYGGYIAWANEKGIVSGMKPDMFEPDSPITREQMCVIICNYAKSENIVLGTGSAVKFSDEEKIADWAHESVMTLTSAGIITGMGNGIFAPKNLCTRAQCASIMKKLA